MNPSDLRTRFPVGTQLRLKATTRAFAAPNRTLVVVTGLSQLEPRTHLLVRWVNLPRGVCQVNGGYDYRDFYPDYGPDVMIPESF